ncbi:uncharacterized protein [Henckelia pumila]|uniref:uncharacterized protein isoform X1 n=1 Tax=Henckelia pumila TaxID=405737 RepID=UPI003C6E7C85
MAAAEEVKFSLKVVMIKGRNKVLYAEIDSDFADVILSFLTFPLGTIARLFIKHYGNTPILGSLNSLYAGLFNLDGSHFGTEAGRLMLLNPRNASQFLCSTLKLQIDDTPPIKFFACRTHKCVSVYYKMRCLCPDSTINEIWIDDFFQYLFRSGNGSVFTAKTTTFVLTDDLEMLINSPASIFQILRRNFIEDANTLEEKTLIVGLKEIMELLKASLVSKTPLTDMVLPTRTMAATLDGRTKYIAPAKYESDALPRTRTQTSQNMSSNSKKINVKAFVQKSSSRVLLAQSRHDFIDFLFSMLTIPLGRVQFLLGENTCGGSIHNLYRSISNSETANYMKATTRLLEPLLPQGYLSLNRIFSLKEELPPSHYKGILGPLPIPAKSWIDPKGKGSFVKEARTLFVVTDDLVVSTPSSISIISTLNQMKIPISDVEERELGIGMEEASSILQASLTSTYALTNGLKPFLKRQPKQEK